MNWTTQPAAARWVRELLDGFIESNRFIMHLRDRMLHETGTRLVDWVACFKIPDAPGLAVQLDSLGFRRHGGTFKHEGGLFPDVEVTRSALRQVFIKVESVADFILVHQLAGKVPIDGEPLAAIRKACVSHEGETECWVIERHGSTSADVNTILKHQEALKLRCRDFDDEIDGFAHARALIRSAIADLGVDRACDLFFQAERGYWQMRNRAAQIQKSRQDALGLGWANHDHHTYRCSRENFAPLIVLLEELGFHCRERFYAGKDAGWGAQVLEQSNTGVVIFADVDLAPDEVAGDFAHEPLPVRSELGTVGLWCGLHGEAFLQAGMHHLECQFDFESARDQLKAEGIETMKPFTDFPYLRQAFTKGEVWPVSEQRINRLRKAGLITKDQAIKFGTDGALGSHLEILQRDDGYKGFNQTGINDIILKTDPRNTAERM